MKNEIDTSALPARALERHALEQLSDSDLLRIVVLDGRPAPDRATALPLDEVARRRMIRRIRLAVWSGDIRTNG